jgi:hypothetical protein
MIYGECCTYVYVYKQHFCLVLLFDILFWVSWVVVMCLCSLRLCLCLCVWIRCWFSLFVGYSSWILSSFFVSSLFRLNMDGYLSCIYRFSFCRELCGKFLFLAIRLLIPILFFIFFSGFNEREYSQEMWYLKAVIWYSVAWSDWTLNAVSVAVGCSVCRFQDVNVTIYVHCLPHSILYWERVGRLWSWL